MDEIACVAISSDQDVYRTMKKAHEIMEERGARAGITFDKRKEEDNTFNKKTEEQRRRRKSDG